MDFFNRLAQDVSTGYWWFTVFVMGIMVNLMSSYAKPHIDQWLASRSNYRKAKLELQNDIFTKKVDLLVSQPQMLIIEGQRLIRLMLTSFFLVGLVFLCFAWIYITTIYSSVNSPLLSKIALLTSFLCATISISLVLYAGTKTAALSDVVNAARKIYFAKNSYR